MTFVPLVLLLAQAPADTAPSPAARAVPARPVVALQTSMGTIKIALHHDKAPQSVDNFLQYVRSGHYDGTIFHRVIPRFMAQAGGFDADMKQKPTRPPVRNEAGNGLHNGRGTVAMARTNDPDSATSQFFINVKDNPALDRAPGNPGYAVFGEVVEGMDVVDKIVAVRTGSKGPYSDVPVTPVVIQSAREADAAKTAAPRAKPSPKASAQP
jgi:peptidyl-prolyl cis-trans isomerase A (cyclophilin A)